MNLMYEKPSGFAFRSRAWSIQPNNYLILVIGLIVFQASISLWIGLPGQMSTDSIIQLYEGRTHQGISFNPPLMSVMLGWFDQIGDAPFLFVLLSQLMLSLSTWIALADCAHPNRIRLFVCAVLILNPVTLEYVGIVWKDILLAHSAILLYFLIAQARRRRAVGFAQLVLFVALLTVVTGARQQGLLFTLPAAFWLASLLCTSKWRMLVCTTGLFIAPILINKLAIEPTLHVLQSDGTSIGVKLLSRFDLAGIVANGGTLPPETPLALAEELRQLASQYSIYRVDTLLAPSPTLWTMSTGKTLTLTLHTIIRNPKAYLLHRIRHFSSLIGFQDPHQCNLMYSGIGGPIVHPLVAQELTSFLHLTPGPTRATQTINWMWWNYADNLLFKHTLYALLLLASCVWLYRRNELVVLTLCICNLLYLMSYSVLGIACDFRYAYILVPTTSLVFVYLIARWNEGIDFKRSP